MPLALAAALLFLAALVAGNTARLSCLARQEEEARIQAWLTAREARFQEARKRHETCQEVLS